MANAVELAEKIAAVKETVTELSGRFASSKGQAESLVAQLSAVGIEGAAQRFQGVVEACEESESGRATLEGGLEKARWQVLSAVHGNMGPGAYGSGPGGKVVPQTQAGGSDGGPAPGGLDAIPPHLRQAPTPTGEELTGVNPTIGPFQKEHDGANDDERMDKLSRFGRKAVRNSSDLVDASKNIVDARADTFDRDYDPWGPTAQTTTEVPSAQPSTPGFYRPEAGDIRAADVVGTSIVVAVVAVEGLSRILRKRQHGK
jgi:hypothetical protein